MRRIGRFAGFRAMHYCTLGWPCGFHRFLFHQRQNTRTVQVVELPVIHCPEEDADSHDDDQQCYGDEGQQDVHAHSTGGVGSRWRQMCQALTTTASELSDMPIAASH